MTPELTVAEQAALTSGRDAWHTTPVESAGLPAITVTDGPHGVRLQADPSDMLRGQPATCFPPAVATASTWDPDLLRRMGEALGDECRAMDVAVLLGPGVNLKRSPLGGRNFEYFSEDPLLAGVLAAAWVNGLQSQERRRVAQALRGQQPGDRPDAGQRRRRRADAAGDVPAAPSSRVVTRARPWTVMCAYNKVNGVYASQHHWLLTEVLRDEWGYEGVVVSDWGAVADRVAAVAAGLDLTMPGPDDAGDRGAGGGRRGRPPRPGAAQPGRRPGRRARRARRPPARRATTTQAAHHALAREIAGRAIVLLKNDAVPETSGACCRCAADGTGTIAVIGEFARTPRYQGGGSSQITPTRLDDALTEITAATQATVLFAPGYLTSDSAAAGERRAGRGDGSGIGPGPARRGGRARAGASDVALVFVGSTHETEGADRDGIDLPGGAPGADRARSPRSTRAPSWCLSNGAVLATGPWDAAVPAVVEGWLLGQAGGGAIADVLFGRSTRPGGWPRRSRSSSRTTRPTWTSPASTGTSATARACSSATGASTRASRRWPTRSASACRTRPSATARRPRPPRRPASRCAFPSPTPATATAGRSSRCT